MASMRAGWKKVFEMALTGQKQGRDVYVQSAVFPMFQKLIETKHTSYQLMSLYRAILGLNADPTSGASANSIGTLRNLFSSGFAIEYYLDNGDVLISKLRISGAFESESRYAGSGLYRVAKSNSIWRVESKGSDFLDLGHKWDGAHYAAVSGRFQKVGDAGKQLVNHAKKAYKDELLSKNAEVEGNHYSLYWSAGKSHGDMASSNAVASLMQQAADAQASVNWLVHGEGAKTFQKALSLLQDAPSLSRFAAKDEETVRYLRMKFAEQKVFLSNPVGSDIKEISALCAKVGITSVKENLNVRDFRSSGTRRNAYKEIAKIAAAGSLVGSVSGAGMKEAGLSALQKAAGSASDIVSSAVANPSVATAVVSGAALYGVFVSAKGSYTKVSGAYKAVQSLMVSTFGKGSEFWYENDTDLLEQVYG
ncbi:hypothetical protein R50072_07670 [Simiduia litorea]|uniref:hypothetical protein n=1 Tax=Simiduia litorea TaxID=1435348 RepID=UPI0036F44462